MKTLTFMFLVVLFCAFFSACTSSVKKEDSKSLGTTTIGNTPSTLSQTLVKQIMDPANRPKFSEYKTDANSSTTAKFDYNGKKYEVTYLITGIEDKIVITTTDYSGEYMVGDNNLDDMVDFGWYTKLDRKKSPLANLENSNFLGLDENQRKELSRKSPWRTKLYLASIEVSTYLSSAKQQS